MTVGQLKVIIGADASKALAAFRSVEAGTAKLQANLKKVSKAFTTYVSAPLAALAGFSVAAWDQQAQAVAKVENGIRSTGGTAGRTIDELVRHAGELQKTSLFGDEEILDGVTAQVLTFTNIVGTQFDRAQQSTLDLATKLGGDLQGAAIQLGKALNDPVANLSALARSGIQFTAAQKATIKALAETNRLAEAQDLILDELDRQYGGTAAAAAAAGAGGLNQLKKEFGDMLEGIGAVIYEGLEPLIGWLRKSVAWFSALPDDVKKNVVVFAGLAFAIGPVLAALTAIVTIAPAVAAAWALLTGPVGLVVAGLVALVAVVIANRDRLGELGLAVRAFAQRLYGSLLAAIQSAVDALAKFFGFLGRVDPIARAAARGLESFSAKLDEAQKSAAIDLSATVGELDRVRAASDGARAALAAYLAKSVVRDAPLSGNAFNPALLNGGPSTTPTATPTVTPTGSAGPSGGSSGSTVASVIRDMRRELGRVAGDIRLGLVEPLAAAGVRAGIIEAALREARSIGGTPGALAGIAAEMATARADAERAERAVEKIAMRRVIHSPRGETVERGMPDLAVEVPAAVEFALSRVSDLSNAANGAIERGVRSLVDGVATGVGEAAAELLQFRNPIESIGEAFKSMGALVGRVMKSIIADIVAAIAKALILAGIKALVGGATGGIGGFVLGALGLGAGPSLRTAGLGGGGVAPGTGGYTVMPSGPARLGTFGVELPYSIVGGALNRSSTEAVRLGLSDGAYG